jgi:large repetitive protein
MSIIFAKTVANVTTGELPATVAMTNDILRYTITIENLGSSTFIELILIDDLGAMNIVPAAFKPGTLSLTTIPSGVTDNTDPFGGTGQQGLIDIRDIGLGSFETIVLEFEIEVGPDVQDGQIIINQSALSNNNPPINLVSDDPNINGPADPDVDDDEDPTQVRVIRPAVPTTVPPGTTIQETTIPETTIPETTIPETTIPETTAPETTIPETTIPETTSPETTNSQMDPDNQIRETLRYWIIVLEGFC